jgi:SpoVK/Ycf46/Vps4 family AAA+-type ATPase
VFLYGPPGNGKSVMGEGIGRVLGGDIYIPHAIDVDGQVIAVFDPVTHQARERDDEHSLIRAEDAVDGRWVRIRRPVITVGGELTLEMLDLRYNQLAGFYEAPLQVKANGGVLVVDDFGRQRVPARDLLNRWVVPLEAKVDYLNLHTGRKFQVPFELMVVFATNLEPQSLADEAFLRRIPYKIFAKNPSYDQYCRIFEMNCRRYGLPYDHTLVEHLHDRYYVPRRLQRRACHPRDLIDQVVTLCKYAQRQVELTPDLLDAVCQSYFLDEGQSGVTSAR